MKKNKSIIFLSLLYSFFILFGTSFFINGSSKIIYKHMFISIILYIILFIILYKIIKIIFNKLDKKTLKKEKKLTNKILILFNNHPFIISLIFIIICWLPYIISYYPIILNPDASFQIKQYLGIDNKYSYYVNLIDKNQIITNHHPVLHTLLLGTCLKIGMNYFNDNIGLFIYSIIQILVLSTTLSYTIKFMKENNISFKYRLITLLIYALVPVFPFYSMTGVKDVLFACFVIWYIMILYEFIKYKDISIKKIIFSIIICILMCLFRNNGIYVLVLTFPLILIKCKKNFIKYLIVFITSLSFYITYDKVILPYFKVTPGSIRETLSIPFQQTARYIKYHEDELSKSDKEIISKILDYDTIKKEYDPELSDPVKNTFNKDATKKDLMNYFNVWAKLLLKHPITYIDATINNVYGYFYPLKTNWYFYSKLDTRIVKDGIDYHYNSLSTLRNRLMIIANIFPYIPILGLIVNIGFSSLLIIFMLVYLISRKKYRELIYLLPSIVLILVCIASPANTYFRYALPNIFSMPLLIGLFNLLRKKNVYEKK